MSIHREPAKIEVSDHFSGRIAAAFAAAHLMNVDLARASATWEPHDWSDFS